MSKRSKATSISAKTKKIVWDRDGGRCIFCRSPYASPEAHVMSRAYGGRGIPQNVVTVCFDCHRRMDQTSDREEYLAKAKAYLECFYGSWDESKVKYKPWTM